jgi:hypothetical protein
MTVPRTLRATVRSQPMASEQRRQKDSGPSWGRDRTVNNGQPRCPTDNQTGSWSAVSAVIEPAARIWHARGHRGARQALAAASSTVR